MSQYFVTIRIDYLIAASVGLLVLLVIFRRPLARLLFRFDDRGAAILSQKKSSEVKTGRLIETVAPLLDQFPVDVRKPGTSTVFLGQPVDYIHFDPQLGISFIEIKSGESALSGSQKKLRELVKAGKVSWKDLRV